MLLKLFKTASALLLFFSFPGLFGNIDTSVFYNKLSVRESLKSFFEKNEHLNKTELCHTMIKCGSDKSSGRHNYTTLYYKLFNDWKNEPLNIFELGLGTTNESIPSSMGKNGLPGASVYGWFNFFPNSQIFGADIDNNMLFQTDKIKTFYCDQRDAASIKKLYENIALLNVKFDIIVEDGLHEFQANKAFLENSLHKLKKGGIYIVENMLGSTVNSFREILPTLQNSYSLDFIEIVRIPNATNSVDNVLLIIQK